MPSAQCRCGRHWCWSALTIWPRPTFTSASAGNEVGDQSAPNGVETLRQLLTVFHREDPTRFVTVGCDRIESEPLSNRARPEFLALLDVVGYNYVDRWRDRIEKY